MNAQLIVAVATAALAATTSAAQNDKPAGEPARARGIAYTVSPVATAGMHNPAFRLSLAVQFAAGRGRIDVVEKVPGPATLLDGVDFTPLGQPGDYYLFDSTAFIVVRRTTRTFTRFTLTDGSYNFQNGREGWPDWFDISSPRVDTAKTAAEASASSRHGRIHVFWHADFDQKLPSFVVLSRGRLTVEDAPFGEATIARWLQPTLALAALVSAGSLAPLGDRVGITTVTPLPREAGPGVTNFIWQQRLSALKVEEIDLARLTLPGDYTEEARPGFKAGAATAVDLVKWRSPPRP